MENNKYPCDICKSNDLARIPSLSKYTGGDKIFTCKNCGFVFVTERRSSDQVANSWSDEIFATAKNPSSQSETFTATRPAIKARLLHVLETANQEIGIENKSLCDIGAGEGVFLNYAKLLFENTELFGIEPSKRNCKILSNLSIKNFQGTIQDYLDASNHQKQLFDIVTILWTLEATQNCVEVMNMIHNILKPNGHIIVATGSRILMPFKKPLQYYVNDKPQDTHCFRFSYNSLTNLLKLTGFSPIFSNRYIDNDILCMIGKKEELKKDQNEILKDDYHEIINFFDRWAKDSQNYYSKWVEE